MKKKHTYRFIVLALLVLGSLYASAQHPDTTDFYYRLQRKASRHIVTQWIYEGVFEDVDTTETPVVTKTKVKITNPYLKYKGKIIRSVRVVVLDPFGYSVNDTATIHPDRLERIGNKYHITTREYVIRNALLFENKKELDPLEISESERLLRLAPYVNDAHIYVRRGIGNARQRDSVDITVVVQDKWSTIVGSALDANNPDLKIVERNILGTGYEFEEGVTWHNNDGHLSTYGKYSVYNFKNTYISAAAFYATAKENNQLGITIDRPFYSPLAKWAGGVSLTRNFTVFNVVQNKGTDEELTQSYPLNYKTQDLWLAKSFPFTSKKSATINQRSKSLVTGARYEHRTYTERPSFAVDTNMINRDRQMVLLNIGFSQRKYYKDRFLFRFGASEDIPQGFSAELLQGTMNKEGLSLWYYTGVKLAAGKHFDRMGYLSGGLGYGMFYNQTFSGSGVVNADAYYFSDLIRMGKWFFRQFGSFQVTQGLRREPYENININGAQMYGFSSDLTADKSKMVLNLEFVMYAPYQLLGFKFAPTVLVGLAKTAPTFSDMQYSYTYQSIALGLLIRNEHLVSNTFEISIGLYPYVPGVGNNIIKFDPLGSHNVRARDYIIGKPELVPYQ